MTVTLTPSGATETMLIPFAELSTGQAAAIRNSTTQSVVNMASNQLRKPVSDFVVRDIQPLTDLGFSYNTWFKKLGTSTGYETLVSGTMSNMRFVGLYGIMDWSEEMNVPLFRIKVGQSYKAIWDIERLYSPFGTPVPRIGFSPTVTILPMNVPYVIERYVYTASAAAQHVLVGFTVEPRGMTISP